MYFVICIVVNYVQKIVCSMLTAKHLVLNSLKYSDSKFLTQIFYGHSKFPAYLGKQYLFRKVLYFRSGTFKCRSKRIIYFSVKIKLL